MSHEAAAGDAGPPRSAPASLPPGSTIVVVTDAWKPQVNGVVRTWMRVGRELEAMGYDVRFVTPEEHRSFPLPSYPEIRLALFARGSVRRTLRDEAPTAIHVATEGPLGFYARGYCVKHGLPFTTSFHTRFHDYVHARTRIPPAWTLAGLKRFHDAARATLVPTESMKQELEGSGFENLVRWTRGVDHDLFRPERAELVDLPLARPIWIYVGRIAVEKNLRALLELDLPGTKMLVGDGPQRPELERAFPDAHFAGPRFGEELAGYFAASDVFVFPSRTDTFGLVLIEALASGTPVAAYPVPGPRDIVTDPAIGAIDEDLGRAAREALGKDPQACRAHALGFTWRRTAEILLETLSPIGAARVSAAGN